MASRTTVVATTDYSDLDFLVFTQSGPAPDIQRNTKQEPTDERSTRGYVLADPTLPWKQLITPP